MNDKIKSIIDFLRDNQVTIRATADESLIVTDQESGEEYIVKDLGYPF